MDPMPAALGADLTADVVKRIRAGDQSAWNDLYARYHDELLFAVRMRLGRALRSKLESEDILQSVMLEALAEIERFRPRGPGSLGRFLQVLVKRKILDRADHFAAGKRAGSVALTDSLIAGVPGFDGEARYRRPERYDRLERALALLPGEMREALLARRVDGLTGRELAERLGLSHDAARKLYSRALARLNLLMEDGP